MNPFYIITAFYLLTAISAGITGWYARAHFSEQLLPPKRRFVAREETEPQQDWFAVKNR